MRENISNDTTDKGLVFKIYKQLMQLYIYLKKIKKRDRYLKIRYFSKEDIQMSNRHMKNGQHC